LGGRFDLKKKEADNEENITKNEGRGQSTQVPPQVV